MSGYGWILLALVVAWAYGKVTGSRTAKVVRNIKRAQRLVARVNNGKG